MQHTQINNPLHGVTLQQIVEYLEGRLGWEVMGDKIKINCFTKDPSIKSSLKFLRKTPWAREKVEQLYISLNNNHTEKSVKPAKRVSAEITEGFVWPDVTKK